MSCGYSDAHPARPAVSDSLFRSVSSKFSHEKTGSWITPGRVQNGARGGLEPPWASDRRGTANHKNPDSEALQNAFRECLKRDAGRHKDSPRKPLVHNRCITDPDLLYVIKAWPDLSDEVKMVVLKTVRGHPEHDE